MNDTIDFICNDGITVTVNKWMFFHQSEVIKNLLTTYPDCVSTDIDINSYQAEIIAQSLDAVMKFGKFVRLWAENYSTFCALQIPLLDDPELYFHSVAGIEFDLNEDLTNTTTKQLTDYAGNVKKSLGKIFVSKIDENLKKNMITWVISTVVAVGISHGMNIILLPLAALHLKICTEIIKTFMESIRVQGGFGRGALPEASEILFPMAFIEKISFIHHLSVLKAWGYVDRYVSVIPFAADREVDFKNYKLFRKFIPAFKRFGIRGMFKRDVIWGFHHLYNHHIAFTNENGVISCTIGVRFSHGATTEVKFEIRDVDLKGRRMTAIEFYNSVV